MRWLLVCLIACVACDDGGGGRLDPDAAAPDMVLGDAAPDDMAVDMAAMDMDAPDLMVPPPRPIETCEGAPFAARGPYPAGVTTLDMNGTPLEVWYPAEPGTEVGVRRDAYDLRAWLPADAAMRISDADAPLYWTNAWRDLPVAQGISAPMVLFSHGLAGYRSQSSFLTEHLATWGFIVAAPDHVERGLAVVLENGVPRGDDAPQALRDARAFLPTVPRFDGVLDATRVASAGHSMGTLAAKLLAQEDGVTAWIALAGAAFGDGPAKPTLVMGGTTDALAQPGPVRSAWEELDGLRRLVSIEGAGHLAFSDICLIGREEGGVLAIAIANGVDVPFIVQRLGEDGCRDTDLPAEQAWPIINHYAVAHLRAALMGEGAGFEPAAEACFSERIADFEIADGPAMPEPEPQPAPEPAPQPDAEPAPQPEPQPAPEPEADPGAGVVECGDAGMCAIESSICCVGLEGFECAEGAMCPPFTAPQACDGPEDCGDGERCCAGFPQGATCKAACAEVEQDLCNDDADCEGVPCQECMFPGASAQVCTAQCP